MSTVITLKRFDGLEDVKEAAPFDGSAPQVQQMPSSATNAAEEDLAPMPVQPSAEQEKIAAQKLALDAAQQSLTDVLRSIGSELGAARNKTVAHFATALSESALTLLPALLDQGFAHDLATASIEIAIAVEPEKIVLRVHPDDHQGIVDALQSLTPPHPITVEKDSTLQAGQVRMFWSEGGAEIDKSALLRNAQSLLQSRIASLTSGKVKDEH